MILLVTILILKVLTVAQGGCPVRCNCTENAVDCVSKNLENVPYFESLTNTPMIIDLSGNSIPLIDIDHFSFDKSDEVKEIYLNSTGLVTIEEQAFDELENLQELYLSNNLLNTLPEKFIINNENMILLDISSNYFAEMPKITSESLEVLAVADSGVAAISDDALDGLPNLRLLLLQQNNLKTVNPVIFDQMGNLFFVRIAYNPWNCNCKTIKLFDYLTDKQFADITEPVQCLTEDNTFVDIYSEKGVVPQFKQRCNDGLDGDLMEKKTTLDTSTVSKNTDEPHTVTVTTVSSEKSFTDERNSDLQFTTFFYFLILSSAVVFSWIIGAACGSYLTFRYINGGIRQTESTKELLTKSDEHNVFDFS